jgi:putative toxin-antitoxin system antitoxin component (TIGR02293 family)
LVREAAAVAEARYEVELDVFFFPGSGSAQPLRWTTSKEGICMTAPPLPITRIVPVIAHAVAVFGDEHKASHWLSTPLPLLDNHAPSTLLGTEQGILKVDEVLTRIEHNIFS